jgi:hypothetical protein
LAALAVFGRSKSADNVTQVRTLLRNRELHSRGAGKAAVWHYPVRDRAYQTLRRWNIDVPPPPLAAPHDCYGPVRATSVVAALGAAAAAGLLCAILRRRRGPVVTRRLRPPSLAVICGLVTVGICLLWWRSRNVVDELMFSTPSARHWFSSYRGGVQFVSLRRWPEAVPLSYATFDLAACPHSPWEDGGVGVLQRWERASFRHVRGTLAHPLGPPSQYQSLHIPLWAVALLAALAPVAELLRATRRRLCVRRWRLQQRCEACGYDLHGSSGGRCPECGSSPRPASYIAAC